MFGLSGYTKIDRTTLLFKFYEVYKATFGDAQPLEQFATWAPTFLSDVNELDLNLIEADAIFHDLTSIERIRRWNPSGESPTEFQERHLKFVESFMPLYVELRSSLESEGLAYQGMAFRKVADDVAAVVANSAYERVWFAGFNALTASEELVIQHWKQEGNARVFWDVDRYFADDANHEAGHYFRKYRSGNGLLKLDADSEWISDALASEEKEVNVVAVQRSMAQVQVAATLVAERLKSSEDGVLSHTAIVLNDEKLLLPLLHALPTELKGVNITMGYGLQHSQAAIFVDRLFVLYARAAQDRGQFYHAHVLALLADPFFLMLNGRGTDTLRQHIIKERKIHVELASLQDLNAGNAVFNESMCSVQGFLRGMLELLRAARTDSEQLADSIEAEFAFQLEKLVVRLSDLVAEFNAIDTLKTLHVFWRQLVRNVQLDFVGEPLIGLQIMGMLETRNLDFEEVIMLGVNEGLLPSSSHSPSYFTFDVRRSYGLACQNERDAVTAYHFYRLMMRAKKMHLIFDQDTDQLGGGEVSRYVQQLKTECPKNIRIRELSMAQEIPKGVFAAPISIPKAGMEYQRVLEHAQKGLSPSALNTFRGCSLKYYFSYVAGFREQEEMMEEVDHATLGTAIHATLEALYLPYLNREVTEDNLKQMQDSAKMVLEEKFRKELTFDVLEGRNLLAFEVALSYVNRTLQHDTETATQHGYIIPMMLEQKLAGELSFGTDDEPLLVRFTGSADRVDQLPDGTVRLIDYKTGSFKKKWELGGLEDLEDSKTDHSFQLLLYAMMYSQQHEDSDKLQPTVFYLRSNQLEKPVKVKIDGLTLRGQDLVAFAESAARTVVDTLLDAEIPFSQTQVERMCEYCEFNQICQRG